MAPIKNLIANQSKVINRNWYNDFFVDNNRVFLKRYLNIRVYVFLLIVLVTKNSNYCQNFRTLIDRNQSIVRRWKLLSYLIRSSFKQTFYTSFYEKFLNHSGYLHLHFSIYSSITGRLALLVFVIFFLNISISFCLSTHAKHTEVPTNLSCKIQKKRSLKLEKKSEFLKMKL